jgi:exopolyphosphatase / guanosine-5'-triphosphate,3'-diphosphate pyrophosphatase
MSPLPDTELNPMTDKDMDDLDGSLLAAIDLGSNSFHLAITRVEHGEARPVERIAEAVQLAANMEDELLSAEAIARGLECLARFRQAIDSVKPGKVRVVGTNALRVARNAREFCRAGEAILGYPLEVVSGREEARLIYLGVAHSLANDTSRLVVDIGGGSTEFIIGERFEPQLMESLYMGCVSYADRFFPKGKISAKAFDEAYFSAYGEMLNIRKTYLKKGWQDVVGSAGTLRAIESVIVAQGWAASGISAGNLEKLKQLLLSFDSTKSLGKLDGLVEKRRGVFPSGLAITCAIFDALKLDEMRTSVGALREGIVYDTIGRLSHEDVRERSVRALMQRHSVDEQNAAKVEETATYLFDSVRDAWGLGDNEREMLVWACRLHEVGLSIAHGGFHKHGQYLVENTDLAGFSKTEQLELGLLVRGHRQKFPRDEIELRANGRAETMTRLCQLLRLSVLLKHVEPVEDSPAFQLRAKGDGLLLLYPCGWLQGHPLTRHALEREQGILAKKNLVLEFDQAL